MPQQPRLELTWIGKEVRPRLEPRILLEDSEKSYHAAERHSDADIFDNMLIHGDNLLALKALEQDFSGKVKCIYIDPPFNTDQAFEFYDDGLEHSLWLSLMKNRIEILSNLLSDDGTLFIHIDDVELAYLIVLVDEILGRRNRVSVITFKQGAATGHKSINPGFVSTSNFIIVYAKDKRKWNPNRVFTKCERDKRYSKYILNIDEDFSKWKFSTLSDAFSSTYGVKTSELKKKLGNNYEIALFDFVIKNSLSVIRTARPDINSVGKEVKEIIEKSIKSPERIYYLHRENYPDMYFINGERILFYKDKLKTIDSEEISGEPLTTIWDDILSNNLHNEGFVRFPKGKKPEFLIKRCLEVATNPGDLVLDSFLGSGTTAAVAHKMGRRWIGIELGDHCYTHCLPRLQKVINGEDEGGITKTVSWHGGGGFRFYELAPSLIKTDNWGNPVINPRYNPEMLAEALCKLEGFTYAPDPDVFWQQGYSTERDFIYVTTQTLDTSMLEYLNDCVGEEHSLLICCGACVAGKAFLDGLERLTVKKIPQAVLNKCEWDHDDYSLNISNLPQAPATPATADGGTDQPAPRGRRRTKVQPDNSLLQLLPEKGE